MNFKNDNKLFWFALIFCVSLFIKIAFMVDYLEDYDAINFAFGLKEYNLFAYKPHFPGYPVYIFIGRIFFYFIQNETLTLTLLSALFGAASAAMVYLIAYELFDSSTAILAGLIFTANPVISILSSSVNSDICALFFLLLFLRFLITAEKFPEKRVKHAFLSSLFLGITFGVRASYLPFLVLWFAYSKFFFLFKLKDYENMNLDDNTFLASIFGLATGVVIWLLPLLYIVGIENYYYEGINFVTGHFTSWGGSYLTDSSIVGRTVKLLWQIFPKGLGLYYYDTPLLRILPTVVFACISFWFWMKNKANLKVSTPINIFFFYAIPYIIWVLLAQNLQKERHFIPILAIFIIYLSYALSMAISKNKYLIAVISIAILAIFMDTFSLLHEHKKTPSPQYNVMKRLSENTSPSDSILYCDDTERFFSYYNANYLVKQVKTAKEMLIDLDATLAEPANIYVTSNIKNVATLDVTEVITFSRSRYISNSDNKITVYKLKRNSLNLLDF